MTEDFLTPKQVAAILRFDERTIDLWLKEGYLPAYRFKRSWRIHKDFLKKFAYKKLKD